MRLLLTGGAVFRNGAFQPLDVAIDEGRIVAVSPALPLRVPGRAFPSLKFQTN